MIVVGSRGLFGLARSTVQVRDALPIQFLKSLCTTLQSDFLLGCFKLKHARRTVVPSCGAVFMTLRHADAPLAIYAATAKTSKQRTIDALIQASPSVVLLRDGELVLYLSTRSLFYQCRFKLAVGKWHRFSTRKASLENAIAAVCDMYDEARYRQRCVSLSCGGTGR